MRGAGLNVVRWCDPAFTMGLEELPLPQGWREGKTVGLNVSPLVLNCAKDKTRRSMRLPRWFAIFWIRAMTQSRLFRM